MPIRPEERDRYPDDWPAISARVRAEAGWVCEWCGAINARPHPETGAIVVLTVAHLNHDPSNCARSNLRARCQKCHNGYDAPHRAAGIRRRRRRAMEQEGQTSLEEVDT
jgi:hypothetical protein